MAVSELHVSGRLLFTGVVRDISERRQLEQDLLRITELERRRIGQDLHDGLGQAITGIGLISQNLANTLRQTNSDGAESVDELTALIKDADQLARTIARNLVPVEVESNGLESALRLLALNSEKLFPITCTFHTPPETNTESNLISTHLYRIAQEAVSNGVKHGKASRIDINLEFDSSELVLSIVDNGIGISEDARKSSTGLGLGIMEYRSRIIRGTFSISLNPTGGTMVRCAVPLAFF